MEGGMWNMHLAATETGLCYVGTPDAPFEELEAWARKRLPGAAPVRDDAAMRVYVEALDAYLHDGEVSFDIPVDLRGTDFQQSVWQELKRIPHGELCAYSDIADRIGKPSAVRAVGLAIGANPVMIVVPCHRVVGKNGKLTGFRGGLLAKAELLRLEGTLQGIS